MAQLQKYYRKEMDVYILNFNKTKEILMKSISVGLLLLSVTLFYQCDAKESSKDANQSANEKQTAKESPTDI